MNTVSNMERYAPAVLRIGLAMFLFWFGFSQLMNPADWLSWVPNWATNLTGIDADDIVYMNGTFEVTAGILLAIGLWTRVVALIAALHLFVIVIDIGLSAIGVRDFGLAVALLSLGMMGGKDILAAETPDTIAA